MISPDLGTFSKDFNLPFFSHSFQYGDAIFEGMSLIVKKRVSIFHPELNYERMQYGADMLNYNYKIDVIKAIKTVFELYKINKIEGYERIYVRPILYKINQSVGLKDKFTVKLAHGIMGFGKYIQSKDPLKVKVSNIPRELPLSRIKASSNYQIAISERNKYPEYDEVIFLDRKGKLLEGSGENIVMFKDNTFYTPKDYALPGITVRFVKMIAEELGFEFKYGSFTLKQVKNLDFIFFTGNAVGLELIGGIHHDKIYKPKNTNLEAFNAIKKRYEEIFLGQDEQYHFFMDEFDDKPERFDKVVKENIQKLGIRNFL